jgi:hypothetical protein
MDWANLGKPKDMSNKRSGGRVVTQELHCSLGPVLDLSSSGLRVEANGKAPIREGQVFSMTLFTLAGPILVTCRAVWVKKVGWSRLQFGLQFMDVAEELRKAIREIARTTNMNETIRPGLEDEYRRSA